MRSFLGVLGVAVAAVVAAPLSAAPLPADNTGFATPYMGQLIQGDFVATGSSFSSIKAVTSNANPGGAGFSVFASFDVIGNVGGISAGGVLIRRDDTHSLGTVTAGLYDYSLTAANHLGSLVYSFAAPSGSFTSSFDSSLLTLAGGKYIFQVHSTATSGVSLYRLNVSSVPVPGAALLFVAGLGVVGVAGQRRQKNKRAIQAV
jgi:hypothetical protein